MPSNYKAHTIYKLSDGTRVPSVTTVLGQLNKPALVDWSHKLGLEGLDYRLVSAEAQAVGSCVHRAIALFYGGVALEEQHDILREDGFSEDIITKASPSLYGFQKWHESMHQYIVRQCEHSMTSEEYRYGGTEDLLLQHMLTGKFVIVDFKSSGSIWDEHRTQIGAYHKLVEETLLANQVTGVDEGMIVRLDKVESGAVDVAHLTHAQLEFQFKLFKHLLDYYNDKRQGREQTDD
jgi:hypothetical protein